MGNVVTSNYGGGIIIGSDSNHNTISGNKVMSNKKSGISLEHSNNNNITGNTISNNEGSGIHLHYCRKNTISDNDIIANNNFGISIYHYGENSIIGNTLTSNIWQGIHIFSSDNNTIIGNIINSTGWGIDLGGSSCNIISGNTLSDNEDGIGIYSQSNNNIITNNTLISNLRYGMILLDKCINNTIYHNNFINNTMNAYDECNNSWDDGEYGNYWDDYRERYPFARKIWLKSIWNTPYEIPNGTNKDNYPLIKQWPDSLSKTVQNNENVRLQRWLDRFPLLNQIIMRLIEGW